MVFEVSNPAPRTFQLRGELDLAMTPLLLGAVAAAVDGPGDVLFDLRDLSSVDPSAIHVMLQVTNPLGDGSLLIAGPPPIMREILEISGIDDHDDARVVDAEPG